MVKEFGCKACGLVARSGGYVAVSEAVLASLYGFCTGCGRVHYGEVWTERGAIPEPNWEIVVSVPLEARVQVMKVLRQLEGLSLAQAKSRMSEDLVFGRMHKWKAVELGAVYEAAGGKSELRGGGGIGESALREIWAFKMLCEPCFVDSAGSGLVESVVSDTLNKATYILLDEGELSDDERPCWEGQQSCGGCGRNKLELPTDETVECCPGCGTAEFGLVAAWMV